jgi:hypothetical protein
MTRPRSRWAVVAAAVPLVMVLTASTAGACPPDRSGREKGRIEKLVRDYFVARDKGWLGTEPSSLAAGKLADGRVAPAAVRQASVTANIARQLADERGLRATAVHTGLARKNRIQIRGHKATAKVTAGTALSWNVTSVGDSSFSDAYVVRLQKEGRSWKILDVSYAPIPSTDTPGKGKRPAADSRTPEAKPATHGGTQRPGVQPAAALRYNRQAAAEYALRWSRSSVLYNGDLLVGDQYNPEYDGSRQDNDCTNFASQVLRAGGWPIHDGWASDNPVNWTPDLWGPRGPSKTWSVASWLYDYAGNAKRGEKWRIWPPEDDNMDIWNLQPGDLLFVDWDPNGHYDGVIDHTMVISGSYTELGFTEPTYSQHTPHRRNVPLSVGIKIATAPKPPVDPGDGMGGQGRTPKYYPVHLKDTFSPD